MKPRYVLGFVAAGAMASPLAVGAANAGVLELYGRANVSLDHLDNGSTATVMPADVYAMPFNGDLTPEGGELPGSGTSSQYLTNNSSRLGIRGSQYLGAGLTGIFQYETTVNLGDGGNLFGAGRTSFLGVQGAFGTAVAGRIDDPLKTAMDQHQLFADQLGDAGNFLGYGVSPALVLIEQDMQLDGPVEGGEGEGASTGRVDIRGAESLSDELARNGVIDTSLDNDRFGNQAAAEGTYGQFIRGQHQNRHNHTLGYTTPSVNGFSGTFVYQPDQGSNSPVENRYAVEGRFDNQVGEGHLFVSLGWLRATENLGDAAFVVDVDPASPNFFLDPDEDLEVVGADDQDVWQLLASYRMPGEWRIMGVVQQVDNFSLIEDNNHRVYGGGVGINVLPDTEVKGHVMRFDHREYSDMDATMYAIGVDHHLSQRTMVYGTWAMTRNDDRVDAQMNAFGHGTSYTTNGNTDQGEGQPVFGEDQWGLSLGLRHDF